MQPLKNVYTPLSEAPQKWAPHLLTLALHAKYSFRLDHGIVALVSYAQPQLSHKSF